MNVLVACEFSGIVREAFRDRGHNAWSLDTLETEKKSPYHLRFELLQYLKTNASSWDMIIAFPPCTYLAVSGARWFKDRVSEQNRAIEFVKAIWSSGCERIAIENPVGVLSTKWRKPDQIIQPWQFGESETKATCLWLKNLPLLKPTNIVVGYDFLNARYLPKPKDRIFREPPSRDRWKNRSRTFQGIADAMAEQWRFAKILKETARE